MNKQKSVLENKIQRRRKKLGEILISEMGTERRNDVEE